MKTAWTDYPIKALGDEPGKRAPARRVTVLSWDGDKYAKVRVEGVEDPVEIKLGYLHRSRDMRSRPISKGRRLPIK